MGRHPEIDVGKIRRISMSTRQSKVTPGMFVKLPTRPASFADFWDGLPQVLAGRDLRSLARAIAEARRQGRPVIWMMGAHVVKVGLGPLLIDLMERDLLTLLAVNGAFAIHDAELALWGHTSEEVADELHQGRFGMVRETSEVINGAAQEAADEELGLGEAIGRTLETRRSDGAGQSILGACYERKLPATVHVAIGTDIVHQHPEFSGAATGEASARDFRVFAAHLMEMAGAVVVNVGSAVLMPEVFLKAYSMARNQGASPEGLVTATLDVQRHYRPLNNVVQRPHPGERQGHYIVGHHEIMLPLLYQGILLEQDRLQGQ